MINAIEANLVSEEENDRCNNPVRLFIRFSFLCSRRMTSGFVFGSPTEGSFTRTPSTASYDKGRERLHRFRGLEWGTVFPLMVLAASRRMKPRLARQAKEKRPAIYRWVMVNNGLSPGRTAERFVLRATEEDLSSFIPAGLSFRCTACPTMNRWAILGCPSGTPCMQSTSRGNASGLLLRRDFLERQ